MRGGKEALRCNQAIAACVREGLAAAGLPETAVQVIETTDRAAVGHLVAMPQYVDVIVPRGGKGLIERVSKEARVPVIKHLDGNCHVYIDDGADRGQGAEDRQQCQDTAAGHLQHRRVAAGGAERRQGALPPIAAMLLAKGIEIRGCADTRDLVPARKTATEEDYYAEYLAAIG